MSTAEAALPGNTESRVDATPLLNDKMKFAIKAAASLVLVYLIGFAQGWSNITTAATTVMLIAAVGSLENAVMNGLLRVLGSIIGAIIGMVFIAIFPQERFLYLLVLSLAVTFVLHLTRTYKGDMTVFMLTGMTMMMMFQNGNTDNVFLYGVDKAFMTLFGIAVYTLVGILIWPVSDKKAEFEHAQQLAQALKKRYEVRLEDEATQNRLHNEALQAQELLQKSIPQIPGTMETNFSPAQWRSLMRDFKALDTLLSLLPTSGELSDFPKPVSHYLKGFETVHSQIETLFDAIVKGWQEKQLIEIPKKAELSVDFEASEELTQLQRATLGSFALETKNLHALLSRIAKKLNALHRPEPTHFVDDERIKTHAFDLLDPEHLKASVITFLIFWTAVVCWILFNPPGGFMVVVLATGLSVITVFTPVKPSLLIIVFTLSFLFAAAAYVGILPYLDHGVELALFLFFYGFIGFYFLPAQLSIFFLLGLVTMNITNQMYYAFDIFLLVLTMFYAFLSLLLLFYYLPFSTKPERLFLILQKRFFSQSLQLARYHFALIKGKARFWQKIAAHYNRRYLMNTVAKMKLWAAQIDTAYFDDIEKEALLSYVRNCERFATLLLIHIHTIDAQKENPLLRSYLLERHNAALVEALERLADKPLLTSVSDMKAATERFEKELLDFFTKENPERYERESVVSFYETISLYRHIWHTFFDLEAKMAHLNLTSLKESRF